MYYLGEGVSRDYRKSYYWFEIAKSQDAANAEHFLDILTRSLSESEIAAIRSEAQEFHLMAAIGELSNIAPAAGPGGSPQGCP